MEPTHTLTFDAFRLEPPPGGLYRGATVIALRPRSLAVLRYLVRHAGRLVTKAESLNLSLFVEDQNGPSTSQILPSWPYMQW